MRKYEVMYIVRPDIEQEALTAETDKYQAIITNDGGEVITHEILGKRRLAYEINKVLDGIYVLVNFEAAATAVDELERVMKISDDVIRFLIVKDVETA